VPDNYRPTDPVPVLFPCPVCREPLNVRKSKKGKPYVTCSRCALQMFVRGEEGVKAFNLLTDPKGTQRMPRPKPEAQRPRGRPRKDPALAERVEQAVEAPAPLSALKVLTGRRS
jgi:transcription elongation factor Elf1